MNMNMSFTNYDELCFSQAIEVSMLIHFTKCNDSEEYLSNTMKTKLYK